MDHFNVGWLSPSINQNTGLSEGFWNGTGGVAEDGFAVVEAFQDRDAEAFVVARAGEDVAVFLGLDAVDEDVKSYWTTCRSVASSSI